MRIIEKSLDELHHVMCKYRSFEPHLIKVIRSYFEVPAISLATLCTLEYQIMKETVWNGIKIIPLVGPDRQPLKIRLYANNDLYVSKPTYVQWNQIMKHFYYYFYHRNKTGVCTLIRRAQIDFDRNKVVCSNQGILVETPNNISRVVCDLSCAISEFHSLSFIDVYLRGFEVNQVSPEHCQYLRWVVEVAYANFVPNDAEI